MTPLDQRLIDPAVNDLVTLLVAATKKANGRLRERRLDKGRREWEHFVRRQRNKREGRQEYQGGYGAVPAARVEVSWWTDAIGRRHWRVVGSRVEIAGNFPPPAMFAAHPLWHVYPDRLMVRQVGGRSDLMAACACGAAGTPAEIGWVGERCGPCHDRIEEGLPPLPAGLPVSDELHDVAVGHLAFAGAGRLVSAGCDGRLVVWDFEDGSRRPLSRRRDGPLVDLAVSADGKVAVSSTIGRATIGGLDGGRSRTVAVQGFTTRLRFSPDGSRLAIASTMGAVVVGSDAKDRTLLPLPTPTVMSLEWLADGSGLAVYDGRRGVLLIDLATGEETPLRPEETMEDVGDLLDFYSMEELAHVRSLAASPDGRWLAVEGAWDASIGLHLCDLPTGEWQPLRPSGGTPGIRALRFTPDGRLALAEADGGVRLWDAATRTLEGTLFPTPMSAWPSVRAFSADGGLLAIADLTGRVGVWPWRRLLGC